MTNPHESFLIPISLCVFKISLRKPCWSKSDHILFSPLLPTGSSQYILDIVAQWNVLKSRLGHGASLLNISKGVPSLRLSRSSWLTGHPVTQYPEGPKMASLKCLNC